ncbi:permease [Bacillus pacificus]
MIGAFLASVFQTFFDRNVLDAVAHNEVIAPIIMMGFSYVLSICSAADSFIAASFGHVFSVKHFSHFLCLDLCLI